MTDIAFDFDEDNMDMFLPTLEYLYEKYGDLVLIRESSSRGWHLWVEGSDLDPEEELRIRDELGDCEGRREGDYARLKGGLKTSRLFTVKGRIHKGEKVVRRAGSWLKYREWRKIYGKKEGDNEEETTN